VLRNIGGPPGKPSKPVVKGVGVLTCAPTDFVPTVTSPEHFVHLEFASFARLLQLLFKPLDVQIRLVPCFGIDTIPDQCVHTILIERIQRNIQGEMLARTRIFKAVRHSLRRLVQAKTWVTTEVLSVFVP
jgi:hypothetical protein